MWPLCGWDTGGSISVVPPTTSICLYQAAKEIDVVAGHVQPLDVWYLIPIAAMGRAKSLRFYPDIKNRRPMWEEYREAGRVLEGGAVG